MLLFVVALTSRAAALPSCSGTTTQCSHNPDNVLAQAVITDASECCAACAKNKRCKSYTAYNESDARGNSVIHCNIFSTVAFTGGKGGCISGLVAPASRTKPMNFIFMFPDTMRAESYSSYGAFAQPLLSETLSLPLF